MCILFTAQCDKIWFIYWKLLLTNKTLKEKLLKYLSNRTVIHTFSKYENAFIVFFSCIIFYTDYLLEWLVVGIPDKYNILITLTSPVSTRLQCGYVKMWNPPEGCTGGSRPIPVGLRWPRPYCRAHGEANELVGGTAGRGGDCFPTSASANVAFSSGFAPGAPHPWTSYAESSELGSLENICS